MTLSRESRPGFYMSIERDDVIVVVFFSPFCSEIVVLDQFLFLLVLEYVVGLKVCFGVTGFATIHALRYLFCWNVGSASFSSSLFALLLLLVGGFGDGFGDIACLVWMRLTGREVTFNGI